MGAVNWNDCNIDDDLNEIGSLISQANTVSLVQVCSNYGIEINEYDRKIQCPFSFHNDNSPSFSYYPKTNSFYCWGCKRSGQSVNFVSLLENIPKEDAASKLLNNFDSEEFGVSQTLTSNEKNNLILNFSITMREFIKKNNTDEGLLFIDHISKWFDDFMRNHAVNVIGIKYIISELEKKILNYKSF